MITRIFIIVSILITSGFADDSNWGYGYADLLSDLYTWGQSPWVSIDSLGASVQNRAIWELTITHTMDGPKETVYMHVRTHPNEIQSFWVADEFINILLSDDPFAIDMRSKCTFHIVPMYNPDGVELGYGRQNANGIDIESNWDDDPMEPEPIVLKNRFIELMNSDEPIRIALNMHSAYGANPRYFWYHHENGTSSLYAQLEQEFIGYIHGYFSGIGPWDTAVSWTSGTADQYPESWWWFNHAENVMALTYEDWNNANAGQFDQSADAILHGINDYLENHYLQNHNEYHHTPESVTLYPNYPNPFNSETTFRFTLQNDSIVDLSIYDLTGRHVVTLYSGYQNSGLHEIRWNSEHIPSGIYLYRLTSLDQSQTRKLTILK